MAFPFRPRSFDRFLIGLGIAAFLCLTPLGAGMAIVAAISIVGLPLTLAMAAIPPLFLFLLIARLFYLAMGSHGKVVSGLLALATLAIIPLVENRRLDALALSLAAGDVNLIEARPAISTLAVVRAKSRQANVCGDFCQRALLNGAVAAIIMAGQDAPTGPPAGEVAGTMFRLERRGACPAIDLKDGTGGLKIAGEKRNSGDKSPADLLRLKAAQGECIIEREASVAEADAVLAFGTLRRGTSPYAAGLEPFADTVSAERLSFHRRENGALVERYRATGVTYHRLLPLLAPSYVHGYGLTSRAGLLRWPAYAGAAQRYRPDPPIEPLLVEALGFDLTLRAGDARAATRRIVAAALERPGAIARTDAKVMKDFFEHIHTNRDLSREDAALALRVLADSRVATPRHAAAPVRKFAADDKDMARRLAGALFDRLANARPDQKEDDPDYLGYTLGYVADAIAALPDDAIRPYRSRLERLARDPEARISGYRALARLSVFGADAVPTLIYLIDDSWNHRGKKEAGSNAWQHPYLAGLQGLCRTGPAGKAAIPLIYERLAAGKIVKFGSYRDLTINMLIGLGADPEDMWPLLRTDDKKHAKERFDREVARARRKIDCTY